MKKYKFWTFITLKSYFDTGLGLTNYFTKLLMVIGIGWAVSDVKNIELILILGLIYVVFCFFLGWAWWHFGFAESSQEFANRYNPFVKEARNGKIKFHPIKA